MSDTHCFRKSSKPGWRGQKERWVEDIITNTLNCFEFDSDVRTPEIICIREEQIMGEKYYAINSHPHNSYMHIEGDITPTLTRKIAKGAADGPLVLIESEHEHQPAISFQERAGCDGGGKGILIQIEHLGSMTTVNNQYVCMEREDDE